MSESNTPAPTTETPAAAPPAETPPPAAPVEGEPPEGTEPPPAAAAPGEDPKALLEKNIKWSQKLSRKEAKIREDRQRFEQERTQARESLERAQLFDQKKLKPIVETYAKRHGMSFQQAFDSLTAEALNPDQPTVTDIVEQALAKEREAQQRSQQQQAMQAQQAQVHHFAQQTQAYVKGTLATSPHEYLKVYEPEYVANFAVQAVLDHLRRTGVELPLDNVLADMNAAEKKRVDLHQSRLRPGDAQAQPNSERGNGAVQPAKPEARKRGTLNNIHAAQRASAPSDEEDLSDEALNRKAAALMRQQPGWH